MVLNSELFHQIEPAHLDKVRLKIERFDSLKNVQVEPYEPSIKALMDAHLGISLNNTLKPYAGANIDIRDMGEEDLIPSSFYILIPRLLVLSEFYRKLAKHGVDLFHPGGIVYYTLEGENGDEEFALVPRIVERYREDRKFYSGRMVKAIEDGLHRTTLADMNNLSQETIFIEGATTKYLPHCVANPWDMIRYYDDVPFIKKDYRNESPNEVTDIRPFKSMILRPGAIWGDAGRTKVTYQPTNI